MEQNLRIPGPTPIPPEVAAALARPMINHRGPEFAAIIGRVTEGLQHFFQTSQPVLGFPVRWQRRDGGGGRQRLLAGR